MKCPHGLLGATRGRGGIITFRNYRDRSGISTSAYADPRRTIPSTGGPTYAQDKMRAIAGIVSDIHGTAFYQHWPRRRGKATTFADIIAMLWLVIPDNLHNYTGQWHSLGPGSPMFGKNHYSSDITAQAYIGLWGVPPPLGMIDGTCYSLFWPADLRPLQNHWSIPSTSSWGSTALHSKAFSVPTGFDYAGIAYWVGAGEFSGLAGWSYSTRLHRYT